MTTTKLTAKGLRWRSNAIALFWVVVTALLIGYAIAKGLGA